MATEFVYSILEDFPNQTVNLAVLTAQIKALPSGATLLDHIDVAGDDLTVFTTANLTTPQEDALDGVIAAHLGVGFVEGIQRLFAEAEQTNTTTTLNTAATLSSGLLDAGDYLLSWYGECSVQTTDNTSLCVVSVAWDGTERASGAGPLSFYMPFSGSVAVSMPALTQPTFTVQFRRAGTANTARVRRIRISITPLPADSES